MLAGWARFFVGYWALALAGSGLPGVFLADSVCPSELYSSSSDSSPPTCVVPFACVVPALVPLGFYFRIYFVLTLGLDIPDCFALTSYSASELYTSSDSKPAFSPGVAFPVRCGTGVVFALFFDITCFCPLARVGFGDFFDCIFSTLLATTFELAFAF